jgi:hypothetical protein
MGYICQTLSRYWDMFTQRQNFQLTRNHLFYSSADHRLAFSFAISAKYIIFLMKKQDILYI